MFLWKMNSVLVKSEFRTGQQWLVVKRVTNIFWLMVKRVTNIPLQIRTQLIKWCQVVHLQNHKMWFHEDLKYVSMKSELVKSKFRTFQQWVVVKKGHKYLLVDGEKGYKYSTTICATLFGTNLWAVCVFVVQIHTQLINWYQIVLHKMVPSNSST